MTPSSFPRMILKRTPRLPSFFITDRCTRIIASLAHGEAATIRSLAAALTNGEGLYPQVALLCKHALCERDPRPPGRIRINSEHTLRPEVKGLAQALARAYSVEQIRSSDEDPFIATPALSKAPMFPLTGNMVRARLLALIHASGGIDACFAAELLGHDRAALQHTIQRLLRDGILTHKRRLGRHVLTLSTLHPCRTALSRLLTGFDTASCGEFSTLSADAGIRRSARPNRRRY